MSEDEIIERVNKFINITVLYGKTYGMTVDDLKKYQQVFCGLLDLYKQEKEKNKELEQKNFYLPAWVGKKYISKDKIRAKREEYEQLAERNKDGKYWTDEAILYDRQAEALRELEEE